MAFTSLQIIQIRGPQWKDDPRINDLINLAQNNFSSSVFGDRWGEVIGLQVLHWLALESRYGGNPGTGTNSGTSGTGNIVSESEGDLSRQFSNVFSSNKLASRNLDLQSTQFGIEILGIMNKIIIAPLNRTI